MRIYNIRLMETRLSDHNMIAAVKLTADRLIQTNRVNTCPVSALPGVNMVVVVLDYLFYEI